MSKPLITIAIPTYNRADKFLKDTLKCALNQTYQNIEILVSDNCSTDNTEELVRSFEDPRLTYYKQQENLGSYGNMNFLLKKAKGHYFHMYHDDDRIDLDFIESCMKAANYSTGKSLIMAGSRSINEHGTVLNEKENCAHGLSFEDFAIAWYHNEINIYLCSSLFGTDYLRKAGGFEKKYKHLIDVAAQFKCASYGKRVDLKEVKASFRKHEGSLTSATEVDGWIRSSLNLHELVMSLATEKKEVIRKEGAKKSAKTVYKFANRYPAKMEKIKAFWKVYKFHKYKYLPPFKYCNEIVPFSGYVLHPYLTAGYIKNSITNHLQFNKSRP